MIRVGMSVHMQKQRQEVREMQAHCISDLFLDFLLLGLHVLQRLSRLGVKLRLWIDSIVRVVFSFVTSVISSG